MSVITLAADSTTLVLNGFIIKDTVEGDKFEIAYQNARTSHTNSSDGGVNIQGRTDAGVAVLTMRVQRFSDSDIFLNAALNQRVPVVFNGSMKEAFVKDGQDGIESFVLENGSHTDQYSFAKNDQDGNNLAEYVLRFRNAQRNI